MALRVVNTDTLSEDVWNNFLTILKDSVTSVTISGSNNPMIIRTYVASYTDRMLDDKTSYPILVVGTPEYSFSSNTFRNDVAECRIEIEILTNQAESADKFKDLINKTLKDNRNTLVDHGIEGLQLDDTNSSKYERGQMKIHSRIMTWSFNIDFNGA
jgi:hypothetical protein